MTMASQDLLRLLNRCITDKTYCDLLLARPQEAVRPYQLDEAERTALLTHKAENFHLLIAQLEKLGLVTALNSSNRPSKA